MVVEKIPLLCLVLLNSLLYYHFSFSSPHVLDASATLILDIMCIVCCTLCVVLLQNICLLLQVALQLLIDMCLFVMLKYMHAYIFVGAPGTQASFQGLVVCIQTLHGGVV